MHHNFDQCVDRRGSDAKKYSADYYAQDVLPMWIADTDFTCPEPIVEKVMERAKHGIYGYPCNLEEFPEAACHWMKTRFGYDARPGEVEYVPGVIPGVIYCLRAFTSPGDKVVLQTPSYPPFREAILNNGRQLLANPMALQNGRYEIDFIDLEKKLSDKRARMMILCNPHNPTGRVFTPEELARILELCARYDVFVVADEIHCDLVYQGGRHTTFLSLGEEAHRRGAVLINPSKTFNTAGFRTGALLAPNMDIHNRIYQTLASNKGYGRTIMGQLAFATAYLACGYYADQLMDYLEGNLQMARDCFAQISQIDLIEPEATYLLWLDCRKTGFDQKALDNFFAERAKVGLNSGVSFGEEGRGFMRLNIACPRSVLEEGLGRIHAACRGL